MKRYHLHIKIEATLTQFDPETDEVVRALCNASDAVTHYDTIPEIAGSAGNHAVTLVTKLAEMMEPKP